MRMLLEIGPTRRSSKADEVVRAKLARKEKIPGFGHRVYHTEDPRATHLRQMSRDLGQRAGQPIWFDMSQRIEALVKAEKKLNPNVDFYSASTYHALGIADRSVHADFRGQPHLRLDGARPRAVREQPPDSAARRYIGPEYPQRYGPLEAARLASLTVLGDARCVPSPRATAGVQRRRRWRRLPYCTTDRAWRSLHVPSDLKSFDSGSPTHPQFLRHRAHRSRQVDAGRPLSRADRRAAGARDGSAGARRDGSRARARHHDQGASGPAALHGGRRREVRPRT